MRKRVLKPFGFGLAVELFLAILLLMVHHEVSAQEARPTEALQAPIARGSSISPEESETRLKDAKILFDRGKTDAAIFMLQQLEKADPTNYKVLFKLGEMAIADRNWAYSISVLRKASLIRPKDIEVRLILIDIYKAYQMPIQGIIVAKEILVLDQNHIIGTHRLAELYQEQAMLEDEIRVRKKLKHLLPENYNNLHRLASIYYGSGQFWEATLIYENIRKYYPDKIKDLTRLAAIYAKLGHKFRELRVIDQIEEHGARRKWLKNKAMSSLRKENSFYDPLRSNLSFRKDEGEEIDVSSISTEVKYTHTRIRSSIDLALEAQLSYLQYKGTGILDGSADINSAIIAVHGIKNWQSGDYLLDVKLGLLVDDVSGKLFARDQNAGITAKDFPFLKDPSFDSYGGVMPVGGLKFLAKPGIQGLHSTYLIAYEHGQVEDFDARLDMFYFDKATLSYSFQGEDNTELLLKIDESAISDGNLRFHALASANYMLLGSNPVHDYQDRRGLPFWRKSFFRKTPLHYLKIGYKWEFFNSKDNQSAFYEVFNKEKRQTYHIEAQTRLYKRGRGRNIFLLLQYSHSDGTTLDYRRKEGLKLFHSSDTNEIGLSLDFEEESGTNISDNVRISGKSRSHMIFAFMKLQF